MPSMKLDYTDPAANDYANILKVVPVLAEKMLAAYNRSDFQQVMALTAEIGKLYAPSDDETAHRIAHLCQLVASAHYFGGINYQVDVHTQERMRRFR